MWLNILVNLNEPNPNMVLKNGYTLKADIVLENIKLLKFIFKRLFY